MGNTQSPASEASSGDALRPMTTMHQNQTAAIKAELLSRNVANPRTKPLPQRNSSDMILDVERKELQQIQHIPICRTYSQRGYRPRSDSLRRMRSVQRRRLLESSEAKNRPPSQRTAKMESENKKIQEEKALLGACARGDLKKVEKLVDSGVDVNSSDQNQMTALHYAAMHTRDDVIKSLISRGAEVNTADLKGGFSAIHWAIINANPKYSSTDHLEGCLTALTEAGCKVNATDFNYATPLHIAAQKGNKDGIQVLLRLGADPDKFDITGRNCFDVTKNEQTRIYMRALIDISSKKVHQLKNRHSYHVLDIPPPSFPAPLPPVLPSRLSYAGSSSYEEHFYHTPEHHSPPSSPPGQRSTSITPPPPPPRKHCQYKQHIVDSHLYHVLEPNPTRKSRDPSPPRKRKSPKH